MAASLAGPFKQCSVAVSNTVHLKFSPAPIVFKQGGRLAYDQLRDDPVPPACPRRHPHIGPAGQAQCSKPGDASGIGWPRREATLRRDTAMPDREDRKSVV